MEPLLKTLAEVAGHHEPDLNELMTIARAARSPITQIIVITTRNEQATETEPAAYSSAWKTELGNDFILVEANPDQLARYFIL